MPKKLQYTAYVTDTKTGDRVHGQGETTVSDTVSPSQYESTAGVRLASQGYTSPDVNITSVEDC